MTKSRRPVSTVPAPGNKLAATVAVVPASKPRNRLAADPLLRKSGAHVADDGKGGTKRSRVAEQDLRNEIAALPVHGRRRPSAAEEDR